MVQTNNLGQTLLEVVIALGIGVIVVTALTIVTISGIRNSQYSQNQLRATKLAQDWIEQIRSFRDQNATICNLGTVTDWNSSTGLFLARVCPTSLPCYTVVQTDPTCRLKVVTQATTDNSQAPFSRQAQIQDYGSSDQEKVTITTSWSDFSGNHQSILVTILSRL